MSTYAKNAKRTVGAEPSTPSRSDAFADVDYEIGPFRTARPARPICSISHTDFITRSRLMVAVSRTFPHIRCKVFIGGDVDAEPDANQIADRFRLELTNGM
jgi:hypothetical protein